MYKKHKICQGGGCDRQPPERSSSHTVHNLIRWVKNFVVEVFITICPTKKKEASFLESQTLQPKTGVIMLKDRISNQQYSIGKELKMTEWKTTVEILSSSQKALPR